MVVSCESQRLVRTWKIAFGLFVAAGAVHTFMFSNTMSCRMLPAYGLDHVQSCVQFNVAVFIVIEVKDAILSSVGGCDPLSGQHLRAESGSGLLSSASVPSRIIEPHALHVVTPIRRTRLSDSDDTHALDHQPLPA